MDENWLSLLSGIVVALPGILALIIGWRRTRAEASKVGNDDLRETNKLLTADNQRLRENMREFDATLKALRLDIVAMRKEYDAEIEKLRDENARLTAMVAELQQANASMTSAISSLQEENIELRQGIDLLSKQIEQLGARPIYHPRTR